MHNPLRLIALLSPVLVGLIAESAGSYPAASSNDSTHEAGIISLPCFMQTSDGKVLNLDSLCGNNEQKGESSNSASNSASDENCFDRSEQQPTPSEDEPESQTQQARSDR